MKRLRRLLLAVLPFAYLPLPFAAAPAFAAAESLVWSGGNQGRCDSAATNWVDPNGNPVPRPNESTVRLTNACTRSIPSPVAASLHGALDLGRFDGADCDAHSRITYANGALDLGRFDGTDCNAHSRITYANGAFDLSRFDGSDCARRSLAASSTIRSDGGRIDLAEWDIWVAGANLLIEVPRRQNRITVGSSRATLASEPFAIARGGHLLTRLVTRDALALEPFAPVGWRDSASGKTYSVRRSGQGYFEPVASWCHPSYARVPSGLALVRPPDLIGNRIL